MVPMEDDNKNKDDDDVASGNKTGYENEALLSYHDKISDPDCDVEEVTEVINTGNNYNIENGLGSNTT